MKDRPRNAWPTWPALEAQPSDHHYAYCAQRLGVSRPATCSRRCQQGCRCPDPTCSSEKHAGSSIKKAVARGLPGHRMSRAQRSMRMPCTWMVSHFQAWGACRTTWFPKARRGCDVSDIGSLACGHSFTKLERMPLLEVLSCDIPCKQNVIRDASKVRHFRYPSKAGHSPTSYHVCWGESAGAGLTVNSAFVLYDTHMEQVEV